MTTMTELDTDTIQRLVAEARRAQAAAYCPYSNFPVGAAILCHDGAVFSGCNVENASYSGTICAERTALVKAVSEGRRRFRAVAITSNLENFCPPCGICRQNIVEFGKEVEIILTKKDESYQVHPLSDLLPKSFGPEDLIKLDECTKNN